MRVFIATLYERNYGSALQAFALQQKLKELGAFPTIIRKPSIKKNRTFVERVRYFFRHEEHYGIGKKIKRFLQRKIILRKNKKIDAFVEKNICIKTYEECRKEMENDDFIFLAGSDQVWSILNHDIDDYYLFNYNIPADKYSYAASTGISKFSKEQGDYYKKNLTEFKVLSFRENAVCQFMENTITDKEVRCDIDPTLLFDKTFWRHYACERLIDEEYIVVYMLRPNNELITMAKKIAEKENCKIIYIGLFANYYSGVITIESAGVEEFLSYIQYASKVITNSFHGTVFSILFEKQFASVFVEGTSERAANLLELVGLKERLIHSIKEIDIINKSYDFNAVENQLNDYRKNSIEYLKRIVSRGR